MIESSKGENAGKVALITEPTLSTSMLRHDFAKAAMQGLLANQFNCSMKPEAAAKESVAMADALLKELER